MQSHGSKAPQGHDCQAAGGKVFLFLVKAAAFSCLFNSPEREVVLLEVQLTEKFLKEIRIYHQGLLLHSLNVASISLVISEKLKLPEVLRETIAAGALLHDLGKIKIDHAIINKPGPLTSEEWDVMRKHPLYGVSILAEKIPVNPLQGLVRFHHERWDGKGYYGLSGEKIPIGARIIALADALDAMTDPRPYRKPRKLTEALSEVRKEACSSSIPGW